MPRSTDHDRAVGMRLKQKRTMQGLAQKDLAHAAGISFQQVQKYERGKNRISASRLAQFAEVLNVTPSYFLDGAATGGLPFAESRQLDLTLMRDLLELNKLFPLIHDTRMRRAIMQVVQAAARSET